MRLTPAKTLVMSSTRMPCSGSLLVSTAAAVASGLALVAVTIWLRLAARTNGLYRRACMLVRGIGE